MVAKPQGLGPDAQNVRQGKCRHPHRKARRPGAQRGMRDHPCQHWPAGQQQPHEADRHECHQQPKDREKPELVAMRHAGERHQEQRRPLEDHVGNNIAHCRGHGDWREGLGCVMAQHDLVREDHTRDRRVERRGDGRGHAATYGDPVKVRHAGAQPVRHPAEERAQIDHRAVLPHRRPSSQRQDGAESGDGSAARIRQWPMELHCADHVGRSERPARGRHVPVDQSHGQSSQRRHQQCGQRDDPGQSFPLHPGPRCDQERRIQGRDKFDKGNCREGGRRPDTERRHRQDHHSDGGPRRSGIGCGDHDIIFRIQGRSHKPSNTKNL